METANKVKNLKFVSGGKQPTALVAGGTGFLGSHLCEALVSQKFNVIAVDHPVGEKAKRNIEGLVAGPNFSLWEEDINKPGFTLSPTIPLTYVFHLASVEDYLAAEEISIQTLLINSLGTKNLLDLAVERKAKFILVSSTEVFHGAISQTSIGTYFGAGTDPTQLTFSEAKRFAETLTAEYFKKYNLATTIIRVKDPYGPRMDLSSRSLLAKLINEAVYKKKIEIPGDGLRTLNPTYVTDIIFGIVKAVLHGAKGEIFNLINPEKYTERAIAELLRRLIGGVEIIYKKSDVLELPFYPLTIGPAEEKLNWMPKIKLEQGLTETIAYYREKESAEKEEKKPKEPTILSQAGFVPQISRKKGQKLTLPRILVFLGSLAVVFWFLILPSGNLVANTYRGSRDLELAYRHLTTEELPLATRDAAESGSSFRKANKASRDILWLSGLLRQKEAMKETQNYLLLGENLALATESLAKAQIAFVQASQPDVTRENTMENLKAAQSDLESAVRALKLATTIRCQEEALPRPLRQSYRKLLDKEKALNDLVQILNKNLEAVL